MDQYQQNQLQQNPSSSTAIEDATPSSERSFFPPGPAAAAGHRLSISSSRSNRRPSRPSSQASSPSLRPFESRGLEGVEPFPGFRDNISRRGSRDESALLSQENKILRQRIRELGEKLPFDIYSHFSRRLHPRVWGEIRTCMLTFPLQSTKLEN